MIDLKKYGITPFGATPNQRQLDHLNIAKKAFFHFGINTYNDAEWGTGRENIALFTPTELDTDQWIRVAKEAGFGLAIITAKHHDGFCLWPSAHTKQSVKYTSYKDGKGDIVGEFAASCRKYGVKMGVYISPWDRNAPHWGSPDYNDYFVAQLTELLTQYGEIHEVWWDGAGSQDTPYDWERWVATVRQLQPKAALYGSLGSAEHVDLRWVGNERGFAGETHFASIDPVHLLVENPKVMNAGQVGERKYVPSETDVSIRPGWFYHERQNNAVKSAAELTKIWFRSVGRNSMLLLNFPPDRRGLVADEDAANALESHRIVQKMLSVNYADGATVTTDSGLPVLTVTDDENGATLDVRRGRVFDICLEKPETINVFITGELVDAGERITGFTLESIDADGNATLLYRGTSVGYNRAVQFETGEYSHLRFTVTEAMDEPLVKKFGLHFIEVLPEPTALQRAGNLVEVTEYDAVKKRIIAAFGGIYAFNYVEFGTRKGEAYRVFAFNGLSDELIAEGVAESDVVVLPFDTLHEGSYQIKIVSECIDTDKTIVVKQQ